MSAALCRNFLTAFLLPILLFAFTSPAEAALVDINTAGSEELQTLNGIGPSYAQRIIKYRTEKGLFQKIEDIKNVSGIGEATFNKIKDSITVGEAAVESAENTNNSQSQSQAALPAQASSEVSSHYSSAPLTRLKTSTSFSVSAGRERLGTVGSPLEFKAESNGESRNISFNWSFGDGSVESGQNVSHAYSYPGEYVVVLNASDSDDEAVSRTNVKVINPQLSISHASADRVEVSNNSSGEINLYGRALVAGGKVFAFPKDTIVKAGQKISFVSTLTGLTNPAGATLVVGLGSTSQEIALAHEADRLQRIALIHEEIRNLQSQLALAVAAEPRPSTNTEPTAESEKSEIAQTGEGLTQQASVLGSVSTSSRSGLANWFGNIKKFFLRNR